MPPVRRLQKPAQLILVSYTDLYVSLNFKIVSMYNLTYTDFAKANCRLKNLVFSLELKINETLKCAGINLGLTAILNRIKIRLLRVFMYLLNFVF